MLIKKECGICKEKVSRMGTHLHKYHPDIQDKEYYDIFLKTDKENICPVCQSENNFISLSQGYRKHCSPRCSSLDEETQQKLKKTNLEKYGTEWNIQSENNRKKAYETMIATYGYDHHMKNPSCKEKTKKTNLEKYGVENVFSSPEVQEKIKKTYFKKYGVEHISQSKEIQEKVFNTKLQKYGDGYYVNQEKAKATKLEKYGDENYSNWAQQKKTREELKTKLEKENNCTMLETVKKIYGARWYKEGNFEILNFSEDPCMNFIKNEDLPLIEKFVKETKLLPNKFEQEVIDFISITLFQENFSKDNDNRIICNTRNVIPPYELDIYLPEMKLAIECDGVYWHSTNVGIPKNYHSNKTKKCEENGIRLIHLTDWEWQNKKEICQSILASALHKTSRKIYARNCIAKEISSKEAKDFLSIHHTQGAVSSQYNYGLFYNEELVQIIVLGKSRFKKNEIELLRMCSKMNTNVVGGFSKLLSFQPFNSFISYVDKSKFTGDGYIRNGFSFEQETSEGYCYYKHDIKLSRQSAQKSKLKKLLKNYDPNLTEYENMKNNGWLRVYDCGNLKMKYQREENDDSKKY